jgi:hypothetical protein
MKKGDSVSSNSRRGLLLFLWACALGMFVMSETLLVRLEIRRDGIELLSLFFWFPIVMLTVPLTSGLAILRARVKVGPRSAHEVNSTGVHLQIVDMVCASYVATLACLLLR